MDIEKQIKSLKIGLSVLFLFCLTACVHDPYYGGPPAHVHPPPYYDYYYYPSVRVYFHYSTGYYYYPSGRRWIRTKKLPSRILLDPRERTYTRVESNKPYVKQQNIRKKYPPRPQYKADPNMDRQERQVHKKWYREHQQKQEQYEKKRGKRSKKY